MNDCIFCKIVKGEIPSTGKVYEDDICMAFLSLRQNNDGHTLLIPKKHFRNILETDDDVLSHIGTKLKLIANAVKKGMNADGINIISNLESAAGQVIFHTHIHIIPRYENDGFHHWPQKDGYTPEKAQEITEKIKLFL